ncbi:MAG TPA: DUF5709 domain-containing protein [Mycobacteriales bacterium]|jgi:hypothetical protein|nr:DUF5709 domain-containing protein [Mycobacteriales bacterium]
MRDDATPVATQADTGVSGIDIDVDESMTAGEILDREHSPVERPVAVDDFGTTAEEQREGESLDGRLAREQPDPALEVEVPYLSEAEGLGDAPAGRLVEPDEGAREDDVKENVAYDAGRDEGQRSAEEAAMHTFEA